MKVVLDASVVVPLVIRRPLSAPADARWREWVERADDLYAPALMEYEVVSAVRKHQAAGGFERPEDAEGALDRIEELGLKILGPAPELNHLALEWAGRLGDRVAYDAQYVALAESLGAVFWTADGALALAARRACFGRVRVLVPLVPVPRLEEDLREEIRRLIAGHEGDLPGLLRDGAWESEHLNRPSLDEAGSLVCAVLDDRTGRPVGLVAWSGPKYGVTPAWWIAPDFRGRGFGSRAVRALAYELWNRGVTGIGRIDIILGDCPACAPASQEMAERSRSMAQRLRDAFDEISRACAGRSMGEKAARLRGLGGPGGGPPEGPSAHGPGRPGGPDGP